MTNTATPRRVAIVGAGAMGCLFAARLALSGNDVTLVDVDRARLACIAEDGLWLEDERGKHLAHPRAATAADVAGPVDLLIVFTKGNHTAAAVESVRHLAASGPVALSLQNGIGNAEIIAGVFGSERTLYGTAHIPADLKAVNRVATHAPNSLALGSANAMAARLARDVAALLEGAGFNSSVSSDIDRTVWEKLAFNAALNASAMICEKANGGLDNPEGLRIARAVIAEAVVVANASNIALDPAKIDNAVVSALAEHKHHKASMLQDREAGRATEIAMINGAIVREGKRHGVETPVCATLTDLVRLIEAR